MSQEDNLFEVSTTALVSMTDSQAMSTWTDEKKKEFVATFDARVRSARFILERTATHILVVAQRRKFVSEFHLTKLQYKINLQEEINYYRPTHLVDPQVNRNIATCGGRSLAELDEIAKERAKKISSELPILSQAIKIIDPETSAKMDQRDKLMAQGQKLIQELDEANEVLKMSDQDPDMTLRDFLKLIKTRERRRTVLMLKLNEIGKDGASLEDSINKKLFKGLPGLSEAIIEAAMAHIERSTALDQMLRRVSEQVQFGDSTEAMELLKFFESDEASLPDTISNAIKLAVEKLKIAPRKQLKKG